MNVKLRYVSYVSAIRLIKTASFPKSDAFFNAGEYLPYLGNIFDNTKVRRIRLWERGKQILTPNWIRSLNTSDIKQSFGFDWWSFSMPILIESKTFYRPANLCSIYLLVELYFPPLNV